MRSLALIEKEKYEQVWDNPAYRKVSPGELVAKDFSDAIRGSVIDFGCGTGRAALIISEKWPVTLLDHAENCLDDKVKEAGLKVKQHCLWEPYDDLKDWGFCCDVLEHIPEEKVEAVLDTIANSCVEGAYLRIYLHKDNGKFSKEPLHLTVKPYGWWEEVLKSHWKYVSGTDNGTVATFWVKHRND